MFKKILILPGDGIGAEITAEAVKVIAVLNSQFGLAVETEFADIGGTAYDRTGTPLPEHSLALAKEADAMLLGAVGGYKWESLDMPVRPESALLRMRSELGLYANLRPAILYPELVAASTLQPQVVSGLDIMIVRELTGGLYFGSPRGIHINQNGEREGFNTLRYSEKEISRIAHSAFTIAMKRNRRLVSVDKANVLEVSKLWRELVTDISSQYAEVELSHMYVDNAAMQLVRKPKQFDVMLTTNMFGDILSDCAAMLTGSIGMLPSASLDENNKGMYEPIHGSAPDIAGKNEANPLATILSIAMMLRYTLEQPELAAIIDQAVSNTLASGVRTKDIFRDSGTLVGTDGMGNAVVKALQDLA